MKLHFTGENFDAADYVGEVRKRPDVQDLDRTVIGLPPQQRIKIHIVPRSTVCKHERKGVGNDSEGPFAGHCARCKMTFARHVFMECP